MITLHCLVSFKAAQVDLQVSASHVPQVRHDRSKAQHEDCRIEPWGALHFEMAQCRTLTLVTSVELLQSLSKRDPSEGKPGVPCFPSCSCQALWHGPTPTINASKTISLRLQDTRSLTMLVPYQAPALMYSSQALKSCLTDGLPCA